jgi:hypothetical protein
MTGRTPARTRARSSPRGDDRATRRENRCQSHVVDDPNTRRYRSEPESCGWSRDAYAASVRAHVKRRFWSWSAGWWQTHLTERRERAFRLTEPNQAGSHSLISPSRVVESDRRASESGRAPPRTHAHARRTHPLEHEGGSGPGQGLGISGTTGVLAASR